MGVVGVPEVGVVSGVWCLVFGGLGVWGLGSGVLGLSFGVRDSCLGGVVGVAELRGHVEEEILMVRHLGSRFGV